MDRWALRYGGSVSFVCICCDGQSLAETFGKNMKLAHCFNTVAASNPKWGQLGCNGFIVLDQRHSVVCKATSAYMQVREKAFKHVETLIDTLLGGGGRHTPAAIGQTGPAKPDRRRELIGKTGRRKKGFEGIDHQLGRRGRQGIDRQIGGM